MRSAEAYAALRAWTPQLALAQRPGTDAHVAAQRYALAQRAARRGAAGGGGGGGEAEAELERLLASRPPRSGSLLAHREGRQPKAGFAASATERFPSPRPLDQPSSIHAPGGLSGGFTPALARARTRSGGRLKLDLQGAGGHQLAAGRVAARSPRPSGVPRPPSPDRQQRGSVPFGGRTGSRARRLPRPGPLRLRRPRHAAGQGWHHGHGGAAPRLRGRLGPGSRLLQPAGCRLARLAARRAAERQAAARARRPNAGAG
jgi:hypothetical protein